MKERILYKLNSLIIALVFCVIIVVPLFKWVVQEDKMVSQVEKRNLSQRPSFPEEMTDIINYPKEFNQYYSDHFGFREKLTKKYFKIVNQFSQSSLDDVTEGQDGWLFLGSIKVGHTRFNDPMGDAMNLNLFSKNELKEFAKSIRTIKNWLEKRGIKYVYVVAPNKHTIYFDKLPKHIKKKNSYSATDQLVEYLQKNTDVTVVDLRSALLESKKKHQVYYKYDTHWNHYGANVAQFEILKSIKKQLPELITPTLLDESQFTIEVKKNGDLSKYANIENASENDPQPVFTKKCNPVNNQPETESRKLFTTICDTQELNAVVFRDSFFSALTPYISRSFNRATYIWKKLDYDLLSKYVDLEKPDIIIDQVVERSFPYVPSIENFPDREN